MSGCPEPVAAAAAGEWVPAGPAPAQPGAEPAGGEPAGGEPAGAEPAGPGPAVTTAAEPPAPEWWRHDNERWVVGDSGQQPAVVAIPAGIAAERPDTTCDGARVGDLDYRAVSLRGLSHQQAGTPRQDAYLLRITPGEQWLVGCVADGVSNSPLSHLAADAACEAITGILGAALADCPPVSEPARWPVLVKQLPWQQAVDQASAAIVQAASAVPAAAEPPAGDGLLLSEPEASRLMATTAVGFLVSARRTPDGLVPYALVVAAGDSSALVLSAGRWHPVTAVKNAGDGLASNSVEALPRWVRARPQAGFLRPGEALAVISDGIGDSLGQGTGVVGRFLAQRWSCPPDLLAFAGHAAFYRRTFIDDRTAAVIWHRPDGGTQPPPGGGEAGPSD